MKQGIALAVVHGMTRTRRAQGREEVPMRGGWWAPGSDKGPAWEKRKRGYSERKDCVSLVLSGLGRRLGRCQLVERSRQRCFQRQTCRQSCPDGVLNGAGGQATQALERGLPGTTSPASVLAPSLRPSKRLSFDIHSLSSTRLMVHLMVCFSVFYSFQCFLFFYAGCFFPVVHPSTLFLLTDFGGDFTLQCTSTLDFDGFCAFFFLACFLYVDTVPAPSAFQAVLWLWDPASGVPSIHSPMSFFKVNTPQFSGMFS